METEIRSVAAKERVWRKETDYVKAQEGTLRGEEIVCILTVMMVA